MNKVLVTGFKFKPAHIKKRNISNKSNKISKLVYCVCIETASGNFKAYVNIPNDLEFPDVLEIPFTKESYKLKGKANIFTKQPNKKGKYIRLIRNEIHANSFPNLEEIYTPFRDRYVYSGYIVKNDNCYEFEVNSFIDHYINANYLVPNIKLNCNNYEK